MFRYIKILLIILVANKVEGYASTTEAEPFSNATELEASSNRTNFIYKCCPLNQYIGRRKRCVDSADSYSFSGIVVYDENMMPIEESFFEVLKLSPGKFEDSQFRLESIDSSFISSSVRVMQNGDLKLEIPNTYKRWLTVEKNKYCVDFRLQPYPTSMKYYFTLTEWEQDNEYEYDSFTKSGVLISIVFLLLVLIIYIMLPELHNLCGKILIMFVVSLLLAFTNLAAMYFMIGTVRSCVAMTAVTYFFSLSSFFWLTVMSFDIWWTFRSFVKVRPIRRESENTKFVLYSLYAWGVPMIMTIGLVVVTSINLTHLPWFVTPRVPEDGCFLAGGSKFIYMTIPRVFLIFWNFVFYFLAALQVRRLSRRTALLDSSAAGSLQAQHTHKMRFMVYLKLSIVMCLFWLFDFLDIVYPMYYTPNTRKWLYLIADIYGSLVGFIIFLILVCKSHIFKMLHSRYGCQKSSVQKVGPLSKIQPDSEPIKSKQEAATLEL